MKKRLISLKSDGVIIDIIKKDIWKEQKSMLKKIKEEISIHWNAFEKESFKNGKDFLKKIEVLKIKRKEYKNLDKKDYGIISSILMKNLNGEKIIIDYQSFLDYDNNFFQKTALNMFNGIVYGNKSQSSPLIDKITEDSEYLKTKDMIESNVGCKIFLRNDPIKITQNISDFFKTNPEEKITNLCQEIDPKIEKYLDLAISKLKMEGYVNESLESYQLASWLEELKALREQKEDPFKTIKSCISDIEKSKLSKDIFDKSKEIYTSIQNFYENIKNEFNKEPREAIYINVNDLQNHMATYGCTSEGCSDKKEKNKPEETTNIYKEFVEPLESLIRESIQNVSDKVDTQEKREAFINEGAETAKKLYSDYISDPFLIKAKEATSNLEELINSEEIKSFTDNVFSKAKETTDSLRAFIDSGELKSFTDSYLSDIFNPENKKEESSKKKETPLEKDFNAYKEMVKAENEKEAKDNKEKPFHSFEILIPGYERLSKEVRKNIEDKIAENMRNKKPLNEIIAEINKAIKKS